MNKYVPYSLSQKRSTPWYRGQRFDMQMDRARKEAEKVHRTTEGGAVEIIDYLKRVPVRTRW